MKVNPLQIAFSIGTAALGALLQGITGMGLNMFASPLLMSIEAHFIPGPIMVGALTLTILMLLRDRSGIDLHAMGWMSAGMLPGTVLASLLLPVIPLKTLSLLLGGLVLAGVLLSLSGLRFPPRWWILFLAGFFSGLSSTLASIGAPPVALVNQEMEPKRLRATLSGYFTLSSVAALTGIFAAGRFGAYELKLSGLILPGVIFGFIISFSLARRLSRRMSRFAVLGLSAASAVILIVRILA